MEKEYDESIDLWSAGCILSELIQSSEQYAEQNSDGAGNFLFPGQSCFPLSPCQKMREASQPRKIVGKNDQLKSILSIIGDQDDDDTSFVTDPSGPGYLQALQSGLPKIQFAQEFERSNVNVIQAIDSLLQFNPQFRGKPAELLKLPVFDSVRDVNLEKPAPWRINLEVDAEGAFDYESQRSSKFSIHHLKAKLLDEVNIIKSFQLI